MDFFMAGSVSTWAITPIFLGSELGERLTGRFFKIDNEIFNGVWYLFPINIQKMIPILINNTQQSIYLRGFGNISSSRQTFKEVIHLHLQFSNNTSINLQICGSAYSYFTILQQF